VSRIVTFLFRNASVVIATTAFKPPIGAGSGLDLSTTVCLQDEALHLMGAQAGWVAVAAEPFVRHAGPAPRCLAWAQARLRDDISTVPPCRSRMCLTINGLEQIHHIIATLACDRVVACEKALCGLTCRSCCHPRKASASLPGRPIGPPRTPRSKLPDRRLGPRLRRHRARLRRTIVSSGTRFGCWHMATAPGQDRRGVLVFSRTGYGGLRHNL
jgi:hypothetical protein